MNDEKIITAVELWLQRFVIDLNLCPFARRVASQGNIRFSVSHALNEDELTQTLESELELLLATPAIETTLLIHPDVLNSFYDYNDYLNQAESLLNQKQFDGVFQIASFHPQYQFAGTATDDAENYSNRTPFPVLHLLREASVTKAIDDYPDIDMIPENNLQRLNEVSSKVLQQMWIDCLA